MSATVRIKPETHKALRKICELTGRSLQDELERAVETHRRAVFLRGLSADYRALRQNSDAWKRFEAETRLWDTTGRDGDLPEEH